MKTTSKFILMAMLVFFIARSDALPAQETPEIVIYETDGDEKSYNFKYETSDGIARSENGELKDNDNLSVQGAYTFSDDQGKQHTVKYIADENGYRTLPGST